MAATITSCNGVISGTFNVNYTANVGINSNVNANVNVSPSIAYAFGSAANQVQVLYQAVRTFSGSTDTLNLTTGLTDSYGIAIDMTAGKGVFFLNLSTTNTIAIGAGTDPITTLLNSTGTITLNPGAFWITGDPTAAGWVITASTACNFNLTGTSGQQYQVAIIGIGT